MRVVLPNLERLSAAEKDALIRELWERLQLALAKVSAQENALAAQQEQNAELARQLQALEERLGKPPKTPDNSSLPPSKGEKPNKKKRRRKKRKGRPGKGRRLHPEPDVVVRVQVEQCPHCAGDLEGAEQKPHAVYERIEIPPIKVHVTRVELHGCTCPDCGKTVLATAPKGLERGSPFGETIALLATYLRYMHAISYQRLQALFRDVFGLEISQGALANLFRRVQAGWGARWRRFGRGCGRAGW